MSPRATPPLRLALTVPCAAALVLSSSFALAQSTNRPATTPTSSAAVVPTVAPNPARDAFNDGVRALDESRFADAAAAFERSFQLAPVPAVLFNLAFAYRGLGRVRDAISALERFIATPGNASPDRVAAARNEVALLRAALARVTVDVSPSDARVSVDGREAVRERGVALLDPGLRVIELSLDGYRSSRREITLAPGESQTVRVELALVDDAAHLRIEPSVSAARIFIDGQFVGTGLVDRPVRAGSHRVEITAVDHAPFRREVRVGGTGLVRVDATLVRTRLNPWVWLGPSIGVAVVGAVALSGWALWETTLRPNEPLPTPANAWGEPVR
ncbi:MAG: PEGA domain-containing protein [Polyangiales bacterium]